MKIHEKYFRFSESVRMETGGRWKPFVSCRAKFFWPWSRKLSHCSSEGRNRYETRTKFKLGWKWNFKVLSSFSSRILWVKILFLAESSTLEKSPERRKIWSLLSFSWRRENGFDWLVDQLGVYRVMLCARTSRAKGPRPIFVDPRTRQGIDFGSHCGSGTLFNMLRADHW